MGISIKSCVEPTIISRCIKRICPAVTVSGYEITARSVQYSMGLGLHLQLSLTSSEITISWIQRKETSNLRTSEILLFYNLQLFYWHFLEILWLFIFLVFYNWLTRLGNEERSLIHYETCLSDFLAAII